jgi:hypothetical protein
VATWSRRASQAKAQCLQCATARPMGPRPSCPHRPFLVRQQTRVARGAMAKAAFKTAAVPQCLGDDGDDAWRDERAADPLHCPRIDAKPSSDFALTGPSRSLQCLMDSFFQRRGYRRPAKPLPLALGPRKPGADSFLNRQPPMPLTHSQYQQSPKVARSPLPPST